MFVFTFSAFRLEVKHKKLFEISLTVSSFFLLLFALLTLGAYQFNKDISASELHHKLYFFSKTIFIV